MTDAGKKRSDYDYRATVKRRRSSLPSARYHQLLTTTTTLQLRQRSPVSTPRYEQIVN